MANTLEDLAERVDRLVLRHQELQRSCALLEQQLASVTAERDSLKSRLSVARGRVDALLARLPAEGAAAADRGGLGMKQMEFSILGQVYVLGCPDGGEAQLARAVAAVDREMGTIRDAGKVRARERIAVLAALNLAYQLAEHDGAAPKPASAPETAPAASTHTSPDPEAQARIDALVERLDTALGADGQLL